MEITEQKDSTKCALKLEGEMTIYTAMENKVHFTPYFTVEQTISLDMAAVSEFDSSGFQILLLLERQAITNDNAFTIKQPSSSVQEVLTLYNKQDWLN